jgi:hypothetical protein
MTTLDYSIGSFTLSIGGFDATDYLDTLKVTQGTADLGKALTWTGEFELSLNRKAQAAGLDHDDFDPLALPTRWRPDQVPVVLTIEDYPIPTLRIRKYVYNPQTRVGRGDLYQVLDTVAGDRPAEEIATTVGRDGTALTDVTVKLLEAAFAGATLMPAIALSPLTGYLDTRLTSRDPLADAQRLTATNYVWLWVDSAEQIRTANGDPSVNPVLFVRSLGQVEWEPDLENIDFAAEQIIVTGSRQRAAPGGVTLKVLSQPLDDSHDEEGRQIKLTVPTYKKKADLYDLYDDEGKPLDTSDVLAEVKTVLYRYWGINTDFETLPAINVAQGEAESILQQFPPLESLGYATGDLVETVTSFERTAGEVYPDEQPASTSLFVAEKLVERDYARIKYLTKGQTNPDAYPGDTTLEVAKAEAIASGRVEPDGAVRNQKGKDGEALRLEKPPRKEWTVTQADVPLTTQNLRGECQLQPIGWTPFRQKPLVEDIGFLPSQAHADNLARQLGMREIRRRDAVSITMPIPVEWLAAGCPPLTRCQIHNAELQIDEPILILDGSSREMSLSFTGGRIGTIPTIPEPVPPVPFVPVNGLMVVPIAGIRAIGGSAVSSQQLSAIGGTPPYTWATVDTLPAGLTLSSAGVISGTPTTATPGAYYTVQVQDASAATATATVWIDVVAVAAPVAPVAEVLNRLGSIAVEMEVLISTPILAIFAVVPEMEVTIALSTSTDVVASVIPEMDVSITAIPVIEAIASVVPEMEVTLEDQVIPVEAVVVPEMEVTITTNIVGGDAAYIAAQMPNVPVSQRQAVADAAFTASATIGGGTTQYQVVDTLVARIFNWLVFRPGAAFQDNAGAFVAVAGDPVARFNPWIGSIHTTAFTNGNRPTLTASTGASFNGSSHYLITSTASFALPASFSVARKTNALFAANNYPGIFVMRSGGVVKPGIAASNEGHILTGATFNAATNKITYDAATAGEINGTPVVVSDFAAFNIGSELPNATGFNVIYAAKATTSGSKTAAIGADSFENADGLRYLFGEIGDLMWLNAVPTSTERTRITAFLKAFWSIA